MEEHGERIGDKWIEARTIYHALTADKPPPATSKEKEPSDDQIRKSKQWRDEHDAEFRRALESPKHFGSFLGLGHILGEPPPPRVKTAEEIDAEWRATLAQSDNVWT